MPLFRYKAIEANGRWIKSVIDADSLSNAKERLQKQKILVSSLTSLKAEKSRPRLKANQLLSFTRELSQLLKAGLPLYESLLTIEEKQRKSPQHALFADLCDKLKGGLKLSSLLRLYPETFPVIYLSMVHSAEQTGDLSLAFEKLAILLTKQQKLKKQLFAALAYPTFLAGFCLFVIGALFLFIIPSMEELFEGRSLHPMTETVLSISRFLHTHVLSLFLFILTVTASIYMAARLPSMRCKIQKGLYKVPYLKDLLLASGLVRLFRAMHMLLCGGVPLLETLHYAKTIVKSSLLDSLLSQVELQLIEGKKLSQLLSHSRLIPPLVIRMLHIGEETGTMTTIMQSLADIYEEDLDKDLEQIMTFLQPVILLLLGAVVGLVVLSILLPLTDVSSFTTS